MSEARDVVIYFIGRTGGKMSSPMFNRTMQQVRDLLKQYSAGDIVKVINYHRDVRRTNIHSFKYIELVMEDTIAMFKKEEEAARIKKEREEYESKLVATEVKPDEASSKRNKDKSRGLGVQPRFGKKSDFDLFT